MSTTIMAFIVGFIFVSGGLILKIVEKMVLVDQKETVKRRENEYLEGFKRVRELGFGFIPSNSTDAKFRITSDDRELFLGMSHDDQVNFIMMDDDERRDLLKNARCSQEASQTT